MSFLTFCYKMLGCFNVESAVDSCISNLCQCWHLLNVKLNEKQNLPGFKLKILVSINSRPKLMWDISQATAPESNKYFWKSRSDCLEQKTMKCQTCVFGEHCCIGVWCNSNSKVRLAKINEEKKNELVTSTTFLKIIDTRLKSLDRKRFPELIQCPTRHENQCISGVIVLMAKCWILDIVWHA